MKTDLNEICDYVLGNQQLQYEHIMKSKDFFLVKTFEDNILKPLIENVEDEKTLKQLFVWLDVFIENIIRVNDNFVRNGEDTDNYLEMSISDMIDKEIGITTMAKDMEISR